VTDLQGAWVFTVFLLVVFSVLAAVIQQFALHAALAEGRVHAPEVAGLRLLAFWAPTIAVWLVTGIAIGMTRAASARCSSADASSMWLGVLYPLTAWPPVFLARQVKVRLPNWYFVVQAAPAFVLFALGAIPCAL
jgi:hypothetical protein